MKRFLFLAIIGGMAGVFFQLGMESFLTWQAVFFSIPFAILQIGLLWLLWQCTPLKKVDYLWAGLLWGGGLAIALAPVLAKPIQQIVESLDWPFLLAPLAGAWPEELLKATGVVIILGCCSRGKPWWGLIIGASIGMGFEAVENIYYAIQGALDHPDADATGMVSTWLGRMIMGPYLHVCCTALSGWGIGQAFFRTDLTKRGRWAIALGWFFIACAIHFVWNWDGGSFASLRLVLDAVVMYGLTGYVFLSQIRKVSRHRVTRQAIAQRPDSARSFSAQTRPPAPVSLGSLTIASPSSSMSEVSSDISSTSS
ncbi:PrsW family intramembrane metalloprotease [Corynebacterium sp. 3HC-13]|uniref:PrsW family intramembrane metalloprotease n=1 Tax=Corynebacterium poyangense TaxID=2684405 RepID=UPI001CCA139C|nr:PrsW family intramembrane metalloprotease [Corynebacterium poyangense]MBZ8177431.1 PrsW family intramembrane metalloprotease [Corynebacterium poyangense]